MRSARLVGMWCGAIALVAAVGRSGADTATTLGNRGGEGSHAFTALTQAPEANLFTGSSSTAVPIEVPPGRGNMTPDLALSYSSAGGPSPFGFGWDMPVGRIERNAKWGVPRCTGPHTDEFVVVLPSGAVELAGVGGDLYRPRIEDAYVQAQKFTGTNHWVVHDRAGLRYTFGDTDTARVGNSDPLIFMGTNPCRFTTTWALTKIEDPNGNTLVITWDKMANALYPKRIEYGANPGAGLATHFYKLELGTEARPVTDQPRSYRTGAEVILLKRIDYIDVETTQHTPSVIRRYDLIYADQLGAVPEGHQSILRQVTVTGTTDGATFPLTLQPPRNFIYTPSVAGHATTATPITPPTTQSAVPLQELRVANGSGEVSRTLLDMNGDGLIDVLRSGFGATHQEWRVNVGWVEPETVDPATGNVIPGSFGFDGGIGTPWTVPVPAAYLRNVWTSSGPCDGGISCAATDTFDLTGDGIPDYVVAANLPANPHYPSWTLYRGRFTTATQKWEFGSAERWESPTDPFGASYLIRRAEGGIIYHDVVDLNGDGLVDLVVGNSPDPDWSVYLNNGAGFDLMPLQFPAPFSVVQAGSVEGLLSSALIDFNGDGLPDIVNDHGQHWDFRVTTDPPASNTLVDSLEIYFNTGQGFTETPELITIPAFFSGVRSVGQTHYDIVDINGDGLPDWVANYPGSNGNPDVWRVLLNLGGRLEPLAPDGTFDPAPSRVWSGGGLAIRYADGGDTIRDLIDVNGDGMLDRIQSGGPWWQVHLNNHTERPNLLSMIENGLGGTNTIAYAPSSVYDNRGADDDEQSDLPFITWVVQAMRFSDGLCTPNASADVFTPGPAPALNHCIDQGHDRVTKLIYEDGRFDADDREFRGFRRVVQRSVEGYGEPDNDTVTIFGQDSVLRGRVMYTQTYAGPAGAVGTTEIRSEANSWTGSNPGGAFWRIRVYQNRVVTSGLSGATDFRQRINYSADSFGNVTHFYTSGYLDEDRVDTITTFAIPQSNFQVRDRPSHVRVMDQNGSRLLEEKWFLYDDLAEGQVSKGNVTTVRSRLTEAPLAVAEVINEYDSAGFGNITRVIDPNGHDTTTVFDAVGLYPQTIVDAQDLTTAIVTDYRFGKRKLETDPNGASTEYRYDAAGRLACVERPLDYETDMCSVTYDYIFAASPGELSYVETLERQDGQPALQSRQHFDALGRARGTKAKRVVDGAWVDVWSGVVSYDAAGRAVELHHPYLASESSPNNGSTQIDYHLDGSDYLDPLGRPWKTEHSDGASRTALYAGQETVTIDEEGIRRLSRVDPFGRVVEERSYRKEGGVDVLDAVTSYEFDGLGRLLSVSQNGVALRAITYDLMGRKTQMQDQNSGTWRYYYDPAGNLIAEDDPAADQHVQYCYNAVNQPVLRCPLSGDFIVPIPCTGAVPMCGSEEEVRYTYHQAGVPNSHGRLTRVDDTSGRFEVEAFDKRGRPLVTTRTIDLAVNDTSRHATFIYDYDANDRVTEVTYPDGETVFTDYDASGQPIALRNGAQFYVTDGRYDLFGRLTRLDRANGTSDTRAYDGPGGRHFLNQLTVAKGTTDIHLDLDFTYWPRGLVKQITDLRNPGGAAMDPNNVVSNTMLYAYDHVGRLRTASGPPELGVSRTYDYDGMGRITQLGSLYFDYDPQRPHQMTYVHQGSPTAAGYAVDHDANGNRWHKGADTYAYDARDRLSSATVGATTVHFVHDHAGGLRARYRLASGQGQPSLVTRYYSELAETTDGTLTKSYFLGGQRVASRNSTDVAWETASLVVPGVHMLAAPVRQPALHVQLGTGAQIALGVGFVALAAAALLAPWRRRPVAGLAVRHGHAVGGILLWIAGTLPWPIILAPAPAHAGGGGGSPMPRHYHTDHLGSTQVITDHEGNIVEQIRYSPYGEVRGRWTSQGAGILNPSQTGRYEFTGYESDLASGLQYAGARFYDPSLGAFLTHDPAAQFANPYIYTGGNPTNLVDPTGADAVLIGIVVGFIIGFAVGSIRAAIQGASPGDALLAGAIGGGIGAVTAGLLGYVGGALEGTAVAQAYQAVQPALGLYGIAQDPAGGPIAAVGGLIAAYALYSLIPSHPGTVAQGSNGASTGPTGEEGPVDMFDLSIMDRGANPTRGEFVLDVAEGRAAVNTELLVQKYGSLDIRLTLSDFRGQGGFYEYTNQRFGVVDPATGKYFIESGATCVNCLYGGPDATRSILYRPPTFARSYSDFLITTLHEFGHFAGLRHVPGVPYPTSADAFADREFGIIRRGYLR